jgi:adenylate kinase family enzyme
MKVAIFGKPGGGKSTLSQKVSVAANLPLHQLDLIRYKTGGAQVSDEVFMERHARILADERWVIDGFGNARSFEATLREADVLVYVERAPLIHYWWVTKRLILSPLTKPLGWPEGSPMLRSTISSYRFLTLSPKFWTPELKAGLLALQPLKRVYVIRRLSDESALLSDLRRRAIPPVPT